MIRSTTIRGISFLPATLSRCKIGLPIQQRCFLSKRRAPSKAAKGLKNERLKSVKIQYTNSSTSAFVIAIVAGALLWLGMHKKQANEISCSKVNEKLSPTMPSGEFAEIKSRDSIKLGDARIVGNTNVTMGSLKAVNCTFQGITEARDGIHVTNSHLAKTKTSMGTLTASASTFNGDASARDGMILTNCQMGNATSSMGEIFASDSHLLNAVGRDGVETINGSIVEAESSMGTVCLKNSPSLQLVEARRASGRDGVILQGYKISTVNSSMGQLQASNCQIDNATIRDGAHLEGCNVTNIAVKMGGIKAANSTLQNVKCLSELSLVASTAENVKVAIALDGPLVIINGRVITTTSAIAEATINLSKESTIHGDLEFVYGGWSHVKPSNIIVRISGEGELQGNIVFVGCTEPVKVEMASDIRLQGKIIHKS
jgi:hypothetical protein